ncbi:hypothetical protein ACJJTC_000376, partial [Scirpophaga incertulas]
MQPSSGIKEQSPTRTKSLKNRGDELEYLFNIYDPSFLALVWPKISNGVHLRLGHFCWEDYSVFLKDLIDGRAWAYNVVDASGRYQGGLFAGSRFWLGSKQLCSKLDNDFLTREGNSSFINEFYDGEYLKEVLQREIYYSSRGHEWQHLAERDEVIQRAVAADNRPPCRLAYSVAQLRLNVTKLTMAKSFELVLGLCLPRSCSIDDVESIVTFSIMLNDNLKTNKTVPRLTKITSLRHVEDYYHIENDTGALILICVTIFLMSENVPACPRVNYSSVASVSTYENDDNLWKRLLLCYSLAGLFSAHHFFYLKSHYTVEELVSFGGTCGQVLQFVCFVTNRIIRLLPSYAFAILVCGVVARVSRDTAPLSLPEGDEENCDRYWWRNLLYVTNIFPSNER